MDWLRLYVDILDDPKMAALSDASYRTYTCLLLVCRERRTSGILDLSCRDIAWRLRRSETAILRVINELLRLDILIGDGSDNSPYTFKNWTKRQFESDDVSVRVKRYRKKGCNVTGNVTGNVTCNDIVTPPDTDTDTDTDTDIKANIDVNIKERSVDNFSPDPEIPPFDSVTPEKEKAALKEKQKPKPKSDAYLEELQGLVKQVKTRWPSMAIETWYGTNRKRHPDAVLHSLRSLVKSDLKMDNAVVAMAYLQKTIDVEDGKYNAADFDREQAVIKRPIKGEMTRIGDILAMAAKGGANA